MSKLEDEAGDIIGKARRGMGFALDRITELSGVDSDRICAIESCSVAPTNNEIRALATALSLDSDKLLGIAAGWEPEPGRASPQNLIIETIDAPFGNYIENCYIIGCVSTRKAAVIDPGGAVPMILKTLADRHLSLEMALLTHAHQDHIGGLSGLLSEHPGLRVMCHQDELGRDQQWTPMQDGSTIELGNVAITTLFTPGHTPGSSCYLAEGICFVGDTLFAGSIGRPMSHYAYEGMLKAIREKVLSLPDDTVLYCGHGPATTVKEEKAHNPFF